MSSDLARHAADYLRLRRALGHDLADAVQRAKQFISRAIRNAATVGRYRALKI